MASKEYKPIWSSDEQTLSNVLVKDKLETYNVVTEWYDGTPMDDSKIDSDLVYVKYDGKYLLRNFEYGQVLQKDTMDEMRNLSSYEILLLKLGVYKHVQLNGYYEKGDTPAPINYRLSDTEEEDDGGSVIEVTLGEKVEHIFRDSVNIKYYGARGGEDSSEFIQKAEEYCFQNDLLLIFGEGDFDIHDTINVRVSTADLGCTLNVYNNPEEAFTVNKDNEILQRKTINIPRLVNKDKPSVGYEGVNTGVKLYDLYTCFIYTKEILNFNDGFFLTATQSRGCVYNTIFLGHHDNNKHNITVKASTETSWVNENLFIGGRLSKRSSELGNSGILRVDVVENGNGYTEATLDVKGIGTGVESVVNLSSGTVSGVTILNGGTGFNRNTSGNIIGDGTGARVRVVVAEPDSTQIRILEIPNGHSVNNIRFIKTSIEGDNVDRHVWCEGSFCVFDQMRWEAIIPNAHFVKTDTSVDGGSENKIINGGHASTHIFHSQRGSNIRNYVDRSSRGVNYVSFNQSFRLRSSNGTSVIRVYDGSRVNFMNRGITSQSDNEWRLDVGADEVVMKNSSDQYPRIKISGGNGRIYLGTGGSETMPFITSGSGSPEGVVNAPIGSLYLNRSGSGLSVLRNLWEKVQNPNGSNGWRLVGQQDYATPTSRGVVLQAGPIDLDTSDEAEDLDSAITLANNLKDKVNEIIEKLRGTRIIQE